MLVYRDSYEIRIKTTSSGINKPEQVQLRKSTEWTYKIAHSHNYNLRNTFPASN